MIINPIIDRLLSLLVVWCCLTILVDDRKERIRYFALILLVAFLAILDQLFLDAFFTNILVNLVIGTGNFWVCFMESLWIWLADIITFAIDNLVIFAVLELLIVIAFVTYFKITSNAQKK